MPSSGEPVSPALDPQARALLDRMAASDTAPPHRCTPQQARANYEATNATLCGPGEPVAEVSDRQADGVPVRVYRPAGADPKPVLVWLHGGGWVVGSLDSHDALCRRLANRADAVVVSVGYRLAPEHPFPAGLDDALRALRWVAAEGSAVGADPRRLAVGGDSAGGNLAAAAALRVRGEIALAVQVLVYPITDYRFDWDSYQRSGEGYYLTLADMRWYWDQYVPAEADRVRPDAAPLRADVTAAAPAFVLVAGYDPLRDEGLAYAARLRAAGVAAESIEFDGQIHGFVRWLAAMDAASEATEHIAAALRRAWST